jgi:hypothetical protein
VLGNRNSSLRQKRGLHVQFKGLTPHGCVPVRLLVAADLAPASLGTTTIR